VKLRQVIATIAGIVIVAGVSVAGSPYVATAYWHWQSGQDASADVWESCEDPGTSALFRAVAQDLAMDCPVSAWVGWLEEDLRRLGARTWADELLIEPSVSPLVRMRLNFALWRAFDRAPRHLPALLGAEMIPTSEREWMWTWLDQQDVLPVWVDVPLAQDVVGASFLAGDDLTPEQWLAWLWRGTAAAGSISPALRAPAVQRASQELESAAPMFVERPLCTAVTDACIGELVAVGEVSLQADARSWDGGPMGIEQSSEAPDLALATALWRAKYAEDGSSQEAAAWWLQAVAQRSAAYGGSGTLPALASPVPSELGVSYQPGQWGDPAAVLGNRHGSPWATALAAVSLGHVLDEDVSISRSGSLVEISFAGVRTSVDGCGRAQASAGVGEAVSERQVLARAAVEAAGDARKRGDYSAQARLLGLAERADADSFAGFAHTTLDLTQSSSSGHTLGTRIGRTAIPTERSLEWAAAWDRELDDGCPPQVP
jgi:hypothetical protein